MRSLLLLVVVTGFAAAEARAPRLLKYVKPVSPQHLTKAASVRVSLTIATDGKVSGAQVVQGHPIFVQAALDAVRQWRYSPAVLNGMPVEVTREVDVLFEPPPRAKNR